MDSFYYRAAWNAEARYSDEKAVRLSVKRENCDKTEERSVPIFIYHTKDHLA